jgi:glyoxylase-like metal-dependent hydrolase (beta-lactamase superfamily II)
MPVRPYWPRLEAGTLVLVAQTNQGPTLVDTGIGRHDYEHPTRMMRDFKNVLRIPNDPKQTAIHQLGQLGFQPGDVCHIVLTHLHLDHAGGLPDFPQAQVHVFRRELEALGHPRKPLEIAYNKPCFAHNPRWLIHEMCGKKWFDFDAVPLPGFDPEIWMVPLTGHTSGHCGVAIQTESGWHFHCGDAAPINLDFDFAPDWVYRFAIGPHVPRLKAFHASHPEVCMTAGHMLPEFFTLPPTIL